MIFSIFISSLCAFRFFDQIAFAKKMGTYSLFALASFFAFIFLSLPIHFLSDGKNQKCSEIHLFEIYQHSARMEVTASEHDICGNYWN